MVSPGYPAVQTEKALAEDTRRRECPHDVAELHTHKGTMWMSNDGVTVWGRGAGGSRAGL